MAQGWNCSGHIARNRKLNTYNAGIQISVYDLTYKIGNHIHNSNRVMDIRDFNIMDGMAKTEVLATEGVFLAERNEGCYRITLYQVNDFYVEIYYHTTRYFYICIRSFEDVGELYPYLQDIDISEVYKVIYSA